MKYIFFTDKKYESPEEEKVRKGIFAANVEYIKEHNQKYSNGEKSYYLGVNQFTDLVSVNQFMYSLILKAPNKNCSREHFNFLLLSFEENKD